MWVLWTRRPKEMQGRFILKSSGAVWQLFFSLVHRSVVGHDLHGWKGIHCRRVVPTTMFAKITYKNLILI